MQYAIINLRYLMRARVCVVFACACMCVCVCACARIKGFSKISESKRRHTEILQKRELLNTTQPQIQAVFTEL